MSSHKTDHFDTLFTGLSDLHRADSIDDALEEALSLADRAFDESAVTIWASTSDGQALTRIAASDTADEMKPPPESLLSDLRDTAFDTTGEAALSRTSIVSRAPFQSELVAAIGGQYLLSIGNDTDDGFNDRERRIAEGLAATLDAALAQFGPTAGDGTSERVEQSPGERDADALGRLSALVAGADADADTVAKLLELGCDHFGLARGIVSRIDGSDYEIRAVRDPSGTFETGQLLDLSETLCGLTVDECGSDTIAFSAIETTDYRDHPAAGAVSAYIAAPITVDDETYGTVNFSSETARTSQFRAEEREFVTLLAQWIGNEIERQRRLAELERYQTILEAVDDPVYALDADGRFTFVNYAAKQTFGYGDEIIGEEVSIAMDQADIDHIRSQIRALLDGEGRSVNVEFELETANGERRIVENRLALIGDDDFAGSAGILRDITDREQDRQQLEEFRHAIEDAVDGVAILDDGVYQYVDRTHVDMYGFDSKDDLLGNTWRKLYDEAEIERLESVAFPALESEGHWRGRVTGTRPDGSQFPAELSLTIIDGGQLVCTVRDVSEKQRRSQQLAEFQRAIEDAADGVAILDDGEYEYIDQTHVDMYDFDSKDELLGSTWRKLYDEAEVERLESVAFPALESDGHWRGMVTGTRPDGSQFPAELALTIVDDGRLVCTVRDETERQARKRELEIRSAAIEAAIDGIALVDDAGQYTYVNQAHADIYGYDSPDAFLGNSWEMCYNDTETARIRSDAMDDLRETGGWRGEAVGVKDDGATFPQEIALTPLDDGYICVVRDITERKARQQELELKERAMDEASVGIQISDATSDDNELVYVNDGFERITGYTAEDVLGRNPRLLQGEQTDSTKIARIRRAIAEDQPISIELQNQCKDGTTCWNKLSITPVRDEEGRVTNYIGIQQDVTDRRKRLSQLEEYRERLNLSLSATDTGIADWDLTNDSVSWNETLVDLIGRDIDRLEEFESIVHPDDEQRVAAQLEKMLETGEPWVGDLRIRCGGGEYIWLGTRATPTYDDEGNPIRVLVMATDITDRKERQRELQAERKRFQLLTESIDEYAFLIVDGDGDVATWNPGAERLYGYDADTAVGMPVSQFYPESQRETGLPARLIEQAGIAGESANEGWHVRADDSRFYADVRYAKLETDDGEFLGHAQVVRDMTDRRQQQRRTEVFVEESDDVVCILNDDGTFDYVSGSARRVLGYDAPSLTGTNLFDHVHPESREQVMKTFFNSAEGNNELNSAEFRFESADGEWRTIRGRYRKMKSEPAIDGILCYLQDVTELKERTRRFEGIFNQTFQFTGLLDTDGTVLEMNDAAIEFSGAPRDDIVGNSLDDAPWWQHSESVRKEAKAALDRAARGNFVRYETKVMGAAGLRTIDFSLKPVLDDDGRVSLLVVEGRDITDQRRRGQHLAVLERVTRHNIRNDLTKLRGWTQMLYEADDDAEREEKYTTLRGILDKWEQMTDHMQYIKQLLDSQRAHSADETLSSVIDDAVEATLESTPTADITVETANTAEAPVPALLEEAVGELLDNAVTVSDDGPVAVECARTSDGWIELAVRDSGPGLPEAEATVLENGEETPLSHGQGLGLWLVRMITTEIGGDVSVNVDDGGTTITLRVPDKAATSNTAGAQ